MMAFNFPRIARSLVFCGCTLAMLGCTSKTPSPETTVGPFGETKVENDARMEWWREARFGMFIHWGLYAEHGNELNGKRGGGYSEWLVQGVPNAEYEQLVDRFNPVDFDADAIVRLAKQAGMKYIVITTKHHEGFSMWDSESNAYNTMATPWKRDAMKEMAEACRRHDIKLGWYYSVLDWHHSDYLPRREADQRPADGADYNRYVAYMKAQLTELLTNYGDICVIWFDGDWEKGPEQHRSREIVDLIHKLQPQTIVNNRIALPMDYDTPEQRIPEGDIPKRDWETCMTINSSWGYNQFAQDWKPAETLIQYLADIASKGGNFLLNIGPDGKGLVTPQDTERLQAIGKWMAVNGESIYGTGPTAFRSSTSTPWGRCTTKTLESGRTRLYLHVFDWPKDGKLVVPELGNTPARAFLLAEPTAALETAADEGGISILVPQEQPDPANSVVVLDFDGPVLTYHPPQFDAPAPEMISPMEVELHSRCDQLELRYTLDGTPPTKESQLYAQPILLTDTTKITARSFHEGRAVSEIVEATYTLLAPRSAETVEATRPGLEYQYLEAEFKTADELLSHIASDATLAGKVTNFDLSPRGRDENFGMVFDGLIRVPADGVYRFEMTCDDGAQLWIGDQLVVDGDGLHSAETYTGTIAMAEGLQPLRLIYFNGLGGKLLEVKWGLAGQPLTRIEDASFAIAE